MLRLDRMRALTQVYPGVEREDEMVAAFDYCLHGKGGAAPSIDTAMHGLVDSAHVDHLHPDSGIAIATAADGEALTKEIFGEQVVWVPWRRPGFQLGLDIAAIKEANPQAVGCILGGHGITAWGDTSEESEKNSLWIIDTAAAYIAEHSRPSRSARPLEGYAALPEAERRAKAAAIAALLSRPCRSFLFVMRMPAHGRAGSGDDSARPLSPKGHNQAAAIADAARRRVDRLPRIEPRGPVHRNPRPPRPQARDRCARPAPSWPRAPTSTPRSISSSRSQRATPRCAATAI